MTLQRTLIKSLEDDFEDVVKNANLNLKFNNLKI